VVTLTTLGTTTKEIDDVFVTSNVFHGIHFGQQIHQLILCCISWKKVWKF